VECTRNSECKCGYFGIKFITVIGDHLIATLHAADRCGNHGTAGVLETFSRFQVRLFTHHAFTFYFLDIAVGIGDQPVA